MTLDEIALKHGTDKASSGHNYTPLYERYFAPFRTQPITLLEIGIGGYEYYDRGGESLKMWREWFEHAMIVGVDKYAKRHINGCHICCGPQEYLVPQCTGPFNIIIDDASHINPLTIKTFTNMWAAVKPGGYYVIEDIHTSYWPTEYHGQADDAAPHDSIMGFIHWLTHQMHYDVWGGPDTYKDIEFIHFYKEIVFIKKKD